MPFSSKKLLSNQALTLEERVAIARLKRAGVRLDGDLHTFKVKLDKKSTRTRIPQTFIKRLAGG